MLAGTGMSGARMTAPAPALGDFSTVPLATQTPQMIWVGVQGTTVLLANQDLTNAVTIARRPNFAIGGGNTANVPPLGSLAVDGSKTIWALAPVGTANLLVLPGGSQWSPSPAQVAAQINALGLMKDSTGQAINTTAAGTTGAVNGTTSAVNTVNGTLGSPAQDSIRTAIPNNIATTGVPLLNLGNLLANANNVAVAASASTSVGPFSFNQPAFELAIASSFSIANGTTPYSFVVLYWIDPTTGITIAKDTFTIWTAPHTALNSLPFIIRGPSKAGEVKLVVFNLDTVDAVVVTYALLADSRVIPTETISMGLDWKEDSATIQLFANNATRVLPDSNVIATFVNSTLAANGTDTWITPPATGLGYLNFQETGVAGTNITIAVQPVPASIYGSVNLVNDIMVTGNPNKLSYSNLILPNGPLQVQVHNGGAVAANYNGMLVAQTGV